ncbi:nuclease-related domain-containing DEAD/DEAH box helicase [Micromonospora chersina]|uniref:nuclease-related domain-containing DEAD/DEAH box helicase n=1 Tax=Micromonospora chersina TaxID=47854 RepID=UPI0033D8EDFC
MRMIPDQISSSTRSRAEGQLFRGMKLLDGTDWMFVLHSLNLSEHIWKRAGEIDFLVVGSRGVFVLEVKGGRVSCHGGVWTFQDRYGNIRRRRESPFKQAADAMFSLQQRLEEQFGREALRSVTFGYGVVLPDCELTAASVEWSEEMIIDRRQMDRPDGLRRSLGRLASYWRSKPGGRNGRLTPSDAERILRMLRPDFDTVPTLGRVAADVEADLVALTENQYAALDLYARNPRILFQGGAGTGKTMLGVEVSRRAAAAGSRVLFTCRSQILAGFVRQQAGLRGVDVLAAANLPTAQPLAEGRYDVVVVDEAQDMVNFTDLATVDGLLRGGLTDGQWSMFLDSNNQRGLTGRYDGEAMAYLHSIRPAEILLRDNCRNTRQIVTRTQEATGADTGVSSAGEGPDVTVTVEPDIRRHGVLAGAQLDLLETQGVDASDVVLLSPLPLSGSVFAQLPQHWLRRVDVLDLRSLRRPGRGRIGFAQIADFKGLESPFVLLGDVDGGTPNAELGTLYVGMTRARVGLWLVAASPVGLPNRLEASR